MYKIDVSLLHTFHRKSVVILVPRNYITWQNGTREFMKRFYTHTRICNFTNTLFVKIKILILGSEVYHFYTFPSDTYFWRNAK